MARLLGGPVIDLGKAPQASGVTFRSAATLEAASSRYVVVSMHSDGAGDSDHNEYVFFRTGTKGNWQRLPVLAVASTGDDRLYYRLFGDWLVTSASAPLAATVHPQPSVLADVVRVVEQKPLPPTFAVVAHPQAGSSPDVLLARRVTLWNLADGRRVDLAIPEDDSEVLEVFDNRSVLLRIEDKLFLAKIEGSRLAKFRFVAYDAVISDVHWAFYSAAQ